MLGNNNNMIENYVQNIWVENVVILCYFPFLAVFGFRVLYFCSKHFLTILMRNNNKMTKNNVQMVWMQKQVIMCLLVTFASFRVKWPKLLTIIVLSRIDGKQQQNNRKLCGKDLGEKCSYLVLVFIYGRFSWLRSCTFVLSIF